MGETLANIVYNFQIAYRTINALACIEITIMLISQLVDTVLIHSTHHLIKINLRLYLELVNEVANLITFFVTIFYLQKILLLLPLIQSYCHIQSIKKNCNVFYSLIFYL